MRPARLPWKIHRAAEAGFSLAEVVVSAGLLTVSSVALMSVLNSSISSVKSISSRDQIFAAVSADLARAEKLNDYFTCFTGNCSVLDLDGPAPAKYQYAPSSNDQINYNSFLTLCKNSPTNLSTSLVATINQLPPITINNGGSPISINRTARLHPNNGSDRYFYIVEWSPPQGPKTQLILSPTVGQWCP